MCDVGIAFSIFVLERAVRACVCVDGEGSFGSGRAFPALAWWWCVMSLRCVASRIEARWREIGERLECRLYRPSCASSVGRTGAAVGVEMEIVQTRATH